MDYAATSGAAFRALNASGRKVTWEDRVLNALHNLGGGTAERVYLYVRDVQGVNTPSLYSSVTSTLRRLRAEGRVEWTGETVETQAGNEANVYALVREAV